MVWIKSIENNYVNVDSIISITFDSKCNGFVAVVGHRDIRLQHTIYQHKALETFLRGAPTKNDDEILEEIILMIEDAKNNRTMPILDFMKLLNY
ncbi:hypothetical protein [Methanogenium organophilum]|uniref:Uncharacterized protein n=1 Tax=Methanogenium organophilum TaxID=2199 RepID=A0A9X9S338_METOG|nr:hypothetical protein [Methanogenium organophilum]WAI00903.1 hypothetical protein OU421_10850 [Methanogenium organophilum]